ncbi:MAG: PEP-CTERM sorting domain-containing protein [Verrucomicrobiales bacterium]|nr:PEP-CTERM sorting domain-containing protein [Verrucomicrobiales bacterium]
MTTRTVFLVAGVLSAFTTYGQGTLQFSTHVLNSVDARVVHTGRSPINHEAGPVGSLYLGQLYAGPVAAPPHLLQPIGTPTPFRDSPDAARGYIIDGEVVVPGVPAGEWALVKLVAWQVSLGSSYLEVMQGPWPGDRGESGIITVRTGGGAAGPAGILTGLQGFTLSWIPEPSPGLLFVFGGLGLLVRQRRQSP